MKNISIHDFIVSAAIESLSTQCEDGSFPGGHNGPYNHLEMPARNTAHWLSVISYVLQSQDVSHDLKITLTDSAHKAVDYLLSEEVRPYGASFHCRTVSNKDSCNGLIGQAWVIEGLIAAHHSLKIESAIKAARDIFYLHPFDEDRGIWHRVEIDGRIMSFDSTFNHQLWFASIAAQLGDADALKKARRFLDLVGENVQTYSDGIVFHASPVERLKFVDWKNPLKVGKTIINRIQQYRLRPLLYMKSVGYHAFNLYAFAVLKEHFPDHDFWNTKKFLLMVRVTNNESFLNLLDDSLYGWPYNPPGIELAYVGEVFSSGPHYSQTWVTRQYQKTYNNATKNLMTGCTVDESTSSARIYEATRLVGDYAIPRC